jgi:glycerol uptake facilitator-like aquaporin
LTCDNHGVRIKERRISGQFLQRPIGNDGMRTMFDMNIVQFSTKLRGGAGQWVAEMVATAGLLLVILRAPAGRASSMVAAYIGAAYWFTSSTSFANPAAVFGRMFSDSFAGISPTSVGGFVTAELIGATLAVVLNQLLSANSAPKGVADEAMQGGAK